MNKIKISLVILLLTFMSSCGSFEITTSSHYDMAYDNYNYNRIHQIYLSNHRFFYNNIYLDAYGNQRYLHTHPYYKRYCMERDRRIRLNRINHTRNIQRNNSRIIKTPTRTITRTRTRTIRPSKTVKRYKTTPTRTTTTRNRRNHQ